MRQIISLHQKAGQRSHALQIVAPNRYELYVSFILAFIGFYLAARIPLHFYDNLKITGCLLLALVCVYNAILDRKRQHWFEHGIALIWLAVLLFVTASFVWQFWRVPHMPTH